MRLVDSGGKVMGFVRQVEPAAEEEDAAYPTEFRPVDDVLRLAQSKQQDAPGSAIFVELEAGLEWQETWGRLED